MIWHLFAVLIMAICMGGLAFFLVKLSRNRLPKWLIPVFASIGMMGYLAYYDYGWYEFKRSQLPEGSVVIQEQRQTSFLKPWRYAFPAVSSFTVVEGKYSVSEQNRQRLVEYLEYTFRSDPIEGLDTRRFVLNCNTLERVAFDREKGQISGPVEKITEAHPVYRQAC